MPGSTIRLNLPYPLENEWADPAADIKKLAEAVDGVITGGNADFAGNGAEVMIAHGLSTIPTSAYVFPAEDPGGCLGEVWIRMDSTNLYIGNSGSFIGSMSWTAIL
ncbi:hypothetical protein [Desulfitobacterium chlororespirans]|uniref:Uncharacterized protein n=1 Tax=Desulfitobacterium chlororespirans DSM 11544 TaxID=1121395 RepID=A0A1M7TQX4_9FIRM|nr:hypothetical protein [Desulfitobacterium chlororespirans]SHN73100.1 hypothetical protein SAMN02745215_02406 [Desulfitobacterium chlororespirans DSM 11544]